jgi:ADP-heptose:LPS heptosyltransferase
MMPSMKILFITSSRIGDAVLSTGLLDYMAQLDPDAKVCVVCGPLAASLFEGYPNLDRVIALKKERHNRHWLRLWRQVAFTRWDMVIDLRNSAVSRLVPAKVRFIYGTHIDGRLHKVEQCAAVMKLDDSPAPKLWFTAAQAAKTRLWVPDGGPVLALGPAANWPAKTWPADRFIEIMNHVTGSVGILPGARVAVFAAPGEEDVAYKVLNAVPENRRIDVIARGSPGEAAAALARCALYIGNDSGLMHCAAAAGVPTIGLFGPSYPALYRPWGAHADYVATPESFDDLVAYAGYNPKTAPCLMTSLSVETVSKKIDDFWRTRKAA